VITLERIKELLKSPLIAINKAKKERDVYKTFWILILTWILMGLSFSIIALKAFIPIISVAIGIGIFAFGFLFSLFCSYVIAIIMNVLGGKGKYYEALTATTYSSFPVSVGFIIAAILAFIHPILLIVGFILLVITSALSFSIYFKAIKEFFNVDMITTFIGFIILIYIFILSIYIVSMFGLAGILPINSLPVARPI
jgi:hypothetical protein